MNTIRALFSVAVLLGSLFAFGATTASAQNSPSPQLGMVTWTCQAFYLPARSIWERTLAIIYVQDGIKSVAIDGVPVYSFNLVDSSVLTAIDGERIQFDVTKQTWTSDFRGVVSSQGRCER